MDSGIERSGYYSIEEAIEDGIAPIPLSLDRTPDVQRTLDVMDHLFSCEATWHMGHTLAQTVFTCIYLMRMERTSSHAVLNSFCRILRATCIAVISAARTHEVMHDVNAVMGELSESGNFVGHVIQLLAACLVEVLTLVKQSILQAVEPLKELLPVIMNVMIGVIVKKLNEDLKHLKGITATYRITNKILVRHSPYVYGILHPLKVFLEEECVHYLSEDDKTKLRRGSTDKARKIESSLQKLCQGAQRRVGASTDASDNMEYARNLRALRIDAREMESYKALWQCVAPKDKQDNIQF